MPSKVILTKSSHPKSLPVKEIENKLTKFDVKFIKSVSTGNALKIAMNSCQKNDLIIVAGSLFVSSEISNLLNS